MMRKLLVVTAVACAVILGCVGQQEDDWWEHMQLYQIYPRSYKDSNGDGIGDLKGITQNLQHLKDIGIRATWLSPIFPSPLKDFGYDISDYYNIDPTYGTIDDLKELIAEANKLDINILLDFVPNHSSDECEWFKKSVKKEPGFENFYVWHPGRPNPQDPSKPLPPSNWISVFRGPAWTWNEERKEYYLHQFMAEQPDLNYRDPNVRAEMRNVLRYWLNMGIAGFRVDAIPHLVEIEKDNDGNYPDEPISGNTDDPDDYGYLDHIYTRERDETYAMVYEWRDVLDAVAEETKSETRVLLMEAMSDIKLVMLYYGNGTHEGAHFPFNFNLAFQRKEAKAYKLKQEIEFWFNNLPEGRVTNWVIGNHDQPRVATRFGPERSDGVVMIGMLLPGVAVTYQGEEIALRNHYLSWEETQDPQACQAGPELYNLTSRDPARTPFQWDNTISAGFSTTDKTWLPVADNYMELNLRRQLMLAKSPVKMYKQLSQLRNSPAIKYGDLDVKTVNDDEILAFKRENNGNKVVVLVNTDSLQLTVNANQVFSNLEPLLEVAASSSDSDKTPGTLVTTSNIRIEPYEALALITPSN